MASPPIEIFTDGACTGNPGPGGWGALLIRGTDRLEISGGEVRTTNNRMEMMAAIKALQALKKPCEVIIYTDSKDLLNGATLWLEGWKRNNWKRKTKSSVKNVDLWREIDGLMSVHSVTWKWIKGHSDNPGNDRADELARCAIPIGKAQ